MTHNGGKMTTLEVEKVDKISFRIFLAIFVLFLAIFSLTLSITFVLEERFILLYLSCFNTVIWGMVFIETFKKNKKKKIVVRSWRVIK